MNVFGKLEFRIYFHYLEMFGFVLRFISWINFYMTFQEPHIRAYGNVWEAFGFH